MKHHANTTEWFHHLGHMEVISGHAAALVTGASFWATGLDACYCWATLPRQLYLEKFVSTGIDRVAPAWLFYPSITPSSP